MLVEQKVGIIIYILQIMAGMVVMTSIWSKSRKSTALSLLTALQLIIMVWLLFAIIENLAMGTFAYPFVVRRIIIVLYFFGPLWLLFTFDYLDIPVFNSRWRRTLVFLPAIILTGITLFDPDSSWIIREIDGYTRVVRWGRLFVANTVVTYLIGIVCAVLIGIRTLQTRRRIRENLLLAVSTLIPVALNILVNERVIQPPIYDLTPISLSFFVAVIAILAYENKLLDILPYAAREVFASMTEAILIVDQDGAVIEYNPAFRRVFEPLADLDRCRTLDDIRSGLYQKTIDEATLERFRRAYWNCDPNKAVVFQVRPEDGSERQITCVLDPLVDAAGKQIGRLLTFHDITDLRDDTIRSERQRVSGDLHDSLGNSLNIISSNLEYSINRLGDDPDVRDCLQVSYERATSAILDLRRIVDGLAPVDIESRGLERALESLFDRAGRRGVRIAFDKLVRDDGWPDGLRHAEHLYYICQEAVHNAIEHGKPENIRIVLKQNADDLRLYISDDGVGCKEVVRNKGITGMQSRAAALGGVLEYGSPDDGGFVVKLTVPLAPRPVGATPKEVEP